MRARVFLEAFCWMRKLRIREVGEFDEKHGTQNVALANAVLHALLLESLEIELRSAHPPRQPHPAAC